MGRECGERRRIKTSLKHFISMIDSLRLTDRSFPLEERLPTPSQKESTYKDVKQQQQQQNMSIIKNDYTFRLFAAISLFFFFS